MPPKPPSWELTPDEMSALQAQLSTVSVTIAAVSDSLRSAQSVFTTAINVVSVQLADEVASHVLWRKDVDDQIAAQYTRLSVNDARLTQLDSAVSALRAKDTQIDTTLANMASVNTIQAGQLTSVNNRVSALAAADAALLSRLQGDESQLSAVSVRTTTLNNALSALQVANTVALARITSLENALSAFKDEVSVALGKLIITRPQQGETLLTDTTERTEPSLPSMNSAAGSTVVDPTFGTTIMKVTDSNDDSGGVSMGYPYYPVFNKDSTWLHVLGNNNGIMFIPFNPSTFARNGSVVMPSGPPSGGSFAYIWDLLWSGTDANLIYHHSHKHLFSYNVSNDTWTDIKDFSGDLAAGEHIAQQSRSEDDDRWAFLIDDTAGGGNTIGYFVWDRAANTIRTKVSDANVEDVRLSKNGRYLLVLYDDLSWEMWDYQNPSSRVSTGTGSSPNSIAHYDMGTDFVTCQGNPNNDWLKRPGATPTSPVSNLAPYNVQNINTEYISMNADNNLWAMVVDYNNDGSAVSQPFNQEIFQVSLDGSNRVRRICHHRHTATSGSPGQAAHANISRIATNGYQYVAFQSDWGNTFSGRFDMYVVRFQAAPAT